MFREQRSDGYYLNYDYLSIYRLLNEWDSRVYAYP